MSDESGITGLATRILERGEVINNRYYIERIIGRGGMATVYVALDRERDGMAVALKILHKEFSKDKICLERFFREINLLSQIHHPNIVHFYEAGRDNDIVYFAMEYVEGESLQQMVERRKFSSAEIAKLILGVCDGLSEIHKLGVVHRDIKPENLMVTPQGLVKITDFGIARGRSSRLTTKLQKVGSMNYMAPEIWLGKELTPAVDFYALGVVLYELATGVLPFDGETIPDVMNKHLDGNVKPPIDIKPEIPKWLNRLILSLIDKKTQKRPESAEKIMDFVVQNAARDLMDQNFASGEVKKEELSSRSLEDSSKAMIGDDKKTFVFQLTASRTKREELSPTRRKATIIIPLPRRAALIFEIEKPSRDFIFFGVFLASLQIFDWVLTSLGVARHSLDAEANPFIRYLMVQYGVDTALFIVKSFAICIVAALTLIARHIKWIKNVMAVLSCIYLVAAIIPWLYILFNS